MVGSSTSSFPRWIVPSPDRSRGRFWLLYAAAWTPFIALYAVMIARQGAPLLGALIGSFSNVAPAALLGALVWRFAERQSTSGHRIRFLGKHAAFAIVFAAAWALSIAASIYLGAPRSVFDDFLRNAIGWQFLSGLMLYGVIAGIATAAANAHRLRAQEAAAARSEALRVRAELQALRAQLDPHFLFNTLHSLMALVRTDQRAAESALERLGDLLRYVLDVNRDALDEVPLADEWAFVRNYLELEQLRLGARLRVVDNLDPDSLECLIPAFTLQPLVENAIRHGIATQPKGGTLTVTSGLENDALVLQVRDDGAGAAPDAVAIASGVGVRAVRQRLEARYGAKAWLDVDTAPGAGFAVTATMPARAVETPFPTAGRVEASVR
jgi:signal transduction histidine kinase